MSLAVATQKIGWRWSCIQLSSVPNIGCDGAPPGVPLLQSSATRGTIVASVRWAIRSLNTYTAVSSLSPRWARALTGLAVSGE